MELYVKHNITLECLSDWVKLLNTKLEDCEKLPTGKVHLLKLFNEYCDVVDIFFYVKCNKCPKVTKIQSDRRNEHACSGCDNSLKTTETNFFVVIPVEQQIVRSVEKNWKEISEFDTSDKNSKFYSDAHDGSILRDVHIATENLTLTFCLYVLTLMGPTNLNQTSFLFGRYNCRRIICRRTQEWRWGWFRFSWIYAAIHRRIEQIKVQPHFFEYKRYKLLLQAHNYPLRCRSSR